MVRAGNPRWDKPVFNTGQLPTKHYNLGAQLDLPAVGSLTPFRVPPFKEPIFFRQQGVFRSAQINMHDVTQ